MKKIKEQINCFNIRVYRFWFKDTYLLKHTFNALKTSINPESLEFLKVENKREIRVKFKEEVSSPSLGALPVSDDCILVHFCNVQFKCNWFVFRQTAYDLTFDMKPNSRKDSKIILNKMSDYANRAD